MPYHRIPAPWCLASNYKPSSTDRQKNNRINKRRAKRAHKSRGSLIMVVQAPANAPTHTIEIHEAPATRQRETVPPHAQAAQEQAPQQAVYVGFQFPEVYTLTDVVSGAVPLLSALEEMPESLKAQMPAVRLKTALVQILSYKSDLEVVLSRKQMRRLVEAFTQLRLPSSDASPTEVASAATSASAVVSIALELITPRILRRTRTRKFINNLVLAAGAVNTVTAGFAIYGTCRTYANRRAEAANVAQPQQTEEPVATVDVAV